MNQSTLHNLLVISISRDIPIAIHDESDGVDSLPLVLSLGREDIRTGEDAPTGDDGHLVQQRVRRQLRPVEVDRKGEEDSLTCISARPTRIWPRNTRQRWSRPVCPATYPTPKSRRPLLANLCYFPVFMALTPPTSCLSSVFRGQDRWATGRGR